MKFTLLFSAFFFCNTLLISAQPGSLDKMFGEDGVLTAQNYSGLCYDMLIQPDGKLVTAGRGGYNNIAGFLLVRYNSDSSPDLSFGDSGRAVTIFENQDSHLQKITLQPDGKIIAAGYTVMLGKTANTTLVRYKSDGSLDSSFGTNGRVETSLNANPQLAGVAMQKDGKIIVAGYIQNTYLSINAVFIIRYNEDGTLDDSFGSKGVIEDLNSDPVGAKGIALQPDGKILVGGQYEFTKQSAFFIRRYLPDGRHDEKYAKEGEAQYPFVDDAGSYLSSIALQADGKVVAAGSLELPNTDQQNAVLVRFNADGTIDESYGSKGEVITFYGKNNTSQIFDIALQTDGKVIAAIYKLQYYPSPLGSFSVARYTIDGESDSSFADDGIQITQLNYSAIPFAVSLQTDGKIVLAGFLSTGVEPYYFFTLIRYNGDDNNKQPLTVRIKRWLLHHGISWQVQPNKDVRYYAVQRSADNIIYKEIAKLSNKIQVDKYEDAALITGSSYYRLAAIGWDGSKTYSNTVLIDESAQVKVFPNPVRDNLQLQGLATGKTAVSIVDLNGNVRSSSVAGGATYSVNTSQLAPGNYLLKLQHNSTTTTQPFVKE